SRHEPWQPAGQLFGQFRLHVERFGFDQIGMIKKPLLRRLKAWRAILFELGSEIPQHIQISAEGPPYRGSRTIGSFPGMMNKSQFVRLRLKLLDCWNHGPPLNRESSLFQGAGQTL